MPTFFQFKTYFTYWLDQVSEHSLHSPFLFDFYTKVLHGKDDLSQFQQIEHTREEYLTDKTPLTLNDPGAGSIAIKTSVRQISAIAQTSLSPEKYSLLYTRIIRHFKCHKIIELGTSLGVNTLYLAANPGVSVTTFEGSPAIADQAQTSFNTARAGNIKLVEGNINTTLHAYLGNVDAIDFAFLDANHRYAPTLKYFDTIIHKIHEGSVVILDDIHYSEEMQRAWNTIRQHTLVYASIDLYRCGILFFDPSLNKQHVVLQF